MKCIRSLVVLFLVLVSTHLSWASASGDSIITKTTVKPFATLYHQHHDFFGKAFSFQGIEGGVIVKRNFYMGAYAALFVTNLKVEVNNATKNVWIGQGGVNAAYVFHKNSRFHPGCQLNMGIFSLRYDEDNFGLFETNKAAFRLKGLVVSPQLFGEVNIADWIKIRTGFSYNFYFYKDHSLVIASDLNHLSFTFGLVFKGR